jgi:23S rRNA (cytidine1920-2'-O)/16S rRNA (cytidine1409-2'-O)-methyltransferase
VLLLVKPQFEVGPGGLDRRGIVRDPEAAEAALARIGAACQALGWSVIGTHPSALVGGDGNQETFIHARVGTRPAPLIETAP